MGLDVHDTGIIVIDQALKDAGFNTIFLGIHLTVEKVVEEAVKNNVHVIGLSFLAGDHIVRVKELMTLLKQKELKPLVIIGGVIPYDDVPKLKEMGVAEVFLPGTMPFEVINFIRRTFVIK